MFSQIFAVFYNHPCMFSFNIMPSTIWASSKISSLLILSPNEILLSLLLLANKKISCMLSSMNSFLAKALAFLLYRSSYHPKIFKISKYNMIFLSFKIKESNFWWATNAIREPTACTIAYITNGVILLKSSTHVFKHRNNRYT